MLLMILLLNDLREIARCLPVAKLQPLLSFSRLKFEKFRFRLLWLSWTSATSNCCFQTLSYPRLLPSLRQLFNFQNIYFKFWRQIVGPHWGYRYRCRLPSNEVTVITRSSFWWVHFWDRKVNWLYNLSHFEWSDAYLKCLLPFEELLRLIYLVLKMLQQARFPLTSWFCSGEVAGNLPAQRLYTQMWCVHSSRKVKMEAGMVRTCSLSILSLPSSASPEWASLD